MVTKFKVGDIVIGNEKASNRYNITKTGWIGKVVKLFDNEYIGVSKTSDSCYDYCVFSEYYDYCVFSEYFDLFKTSNAVSEQIEKEFEELIFG